MRLHVLVIALVLLAACHNSDIKNAGIFGSPAADTSTYTTIKWIDSLKDIGAVEAGKKTEIKFAFMNIGTKPLFIISAKPGCGCTIADYPKEAIAPGDKGEITADYNVPKEGALDFRKNIYVTANTKGSTSHNIFFYGKIKKDSSHQSP